MKALACATLSMVAVVLLQFSLVAETGAAIWWVDRERGDDAYEGEDLGTADHPYASIQAAVDRAQDGDTVRVLPGDYDNGGYVDDKGHSNRVYIAKRIHLVSTGGAAVTTIRGRYDSGDTANVGANLAGDGVRCVRINNSSKNRNGYGAVVQGFTLLDGYAANNHGYGAAVFCASVDGAYIVDCVIRNCSATSEGTGSIMLRGTYVRCAVYDCISWSVVVGGNAWNCAFSANKINRGVFANTTKAVNCSLYYNLDLGSIASYITFGSDCGLYNCAVTGYRKHHQATTPSVNTVENKTGIFVDPANGDWRLASGSPAIGIADAAALTNHFDFSEAAFPISFTDMAGNPLPLTGAINAGAVQTVRPADTWWVDREKGDDAYEGEDLGTADHPYASIQAAVDRARDGDTVKVLPGDYDNGGYVDDKGHFNRVYIAKRIHLVSTGGAAVTTIRGRHDSGDTALSGANLAGDGVRCVRVLSKIVDSHEFNDVIGHGTVIEGFTLADGYAAKSHGFGGAQLSTIEHYGVFMVDCVVTNCTGTSSFDTSNGVIVGGTLVRCAVLDSPKAWSIVVGARAWNSVFSGNSAERGVFARVYAGNCSLSDNEKCFYINFGSADNDSGLYGVVSVGSKPSSITNGPLMPIVNSLFQQQSAYLDSANGDWRLMPGSPAIGIADASDYTNVVDFSQTPFPIARTDFYGAAMPLSGAINAGAVQTVAQRVYVATPRFPGVSVLGCETGVTNYLSRSGAEDIKIVFDSSTATRPLLAVVTNGVEVAASALADGFAISPSTDSGAFTTVEWVYSTQWYVNAETGSDRNDGFTPETAFATLAAACTNSALIAGDTIRVAEGVYTNGVVAPADGKTIASRAYVKSGVALVADGSKEKTFIVGAGAEGENVEAVEYNTGSNSVRGVYMELDSVLRGFTVCGGRTLGKMSSSEGSNSDPDRIGAGVYGISNTKNDHVRCLVEDCIISNNVAQWGGGARGVRLVRCLLKFNGATRLGGSTIYSSQENCLIDNTLCGSYHLAWMWKAANCTLGSTVANVGIANMNVDTCVLTNCLILCKLGANHEVVTNARNCIFVNYMSNGSPLITQEQLVEGAGSVVVQSVQDVGLGDGYRPVKGSLALDFGDVSSQDPVDLAGVQRIMNGRIDCGCYEYDWRGDYAADIGARGLAVDEASPGVVEAGGKVRLGDGCRIEMTWTHRNSASCSFPVEVTGEGTLSAYVNGALVAELGAADSSFSWDCERGGDNVRLVFSGDGYAQLGRPKRLSGCVMIVE